MNGYPKFQNDRSWVVPFKDGQFFGIYVKLLVICFFIVVLITLDVCYDLSFFLLGFFCGVLVAELLFCLAKVQLLLEMTQQVLFLNEKHPYLCEFSGFFPHQSAVSPFGNNVHLQ